jgi:uncharacterized protein (DUF2147 family)
MQRIPHKLKTATPRPACINFFIVVRLPYACVEDERMFRFALALFILMLTVAPAGAKDLTPIGVWLDASKRIEVKVTPCGDRLCGKLLWFKWPDDDQGLPVVDLKNEDPALRDRPLLGLVILRNLRRNGENIWEGGEIYNPDDGENYHVKMSIQDDLTLRVRVYDLFPIFGETHIWTRIAAVCVGRHNDSRCPE